MGLGGPRHTHLRGMFFLVSPGYKLSYFASVVSDYGKLSTWQTFRDTVNTTQQRAWSASWNRPSRAGPQPGRAGSPEIAA